MSTVRIQLRRGTAADWASVNPTLAAGEMGIESDTNKIKIGDGSATWTALAYINVLPTALTNSLAEYVPLADIGAAGGVAGLNSSKDLVVPGSSIIIEGATDNAHETTFVVTDPTADRTITFPDATGTVALTSDVSSAVAAVIDLAPGTLDTLNELAAALNDDANFASTITGLITSTGTAASDDATAKAGNALTSANTYTDGEITDLAAQVAIDISTAVSAHGNDTTGQHGISNFADLATKNYADSSSSTAATTAQLNAESTAQQALDAHAIDTTSVHGIADTTALATKAYADNAASTAETNANAHTDNLIGLYALVDSQTFTGTVTLPSTTSIGSVSSTEISYINGATANIQYQIDTKAPISNPTFDTLTSGNINTTNAEVSSSFTAHDVTINGDLVVNGTTTTINTTQLNLKDNLIYLNEAEQATVTNAVGNGTTVTYTADNSFTAGAVVKVTGITPSGLNTDWVEIQSATATQFVVTKADTDTYASGGTALSKNEINPDLGFVGGYNDGTYKHAGFVKDASDNGIWKLFDGVTTEPTNSVDFTSYERGALSVGALFATGAAIGDVTNTELQYVHGVTSAIQTQIDTKAPSVNPTFTGTVALPSDTTIGSVSATEIGYLDGVSSSIQNQIGTKAPSADPTFTGNVTLPSTTSIGNVGSAEIEYLNGVTSAVQTQLDAKAPSADPTFTGTVTVSSNGIVFTDGTQTKQGVPSITPIVSKTANYTLDTLTLRDSLVEIDSTSGVTITIPEDSTVDYPVGTSFDIMGINTGLVTVAPANGNVTVNATPGLKLRAQWSSATVLKRASNSWVVYGDLKA